MHLALLKYCMFAAIQNLRGGHGVWWELSEIRLWIEENKCCTMLSRAVLSHMDVSCCV